MSMGRLARSMIILLGLLLVAAETVKAATPPHIIQTDLEPLIRAGASSRTQFAVEIPFEASTANQGAWSVAHGRAVWHYAVRIPTAVSLSFHASHVRLPRSAVLTVKSRSTTVTYRGGDLHGSELWSRIHPGDTLEFSLSVLSNEKPSTLLEIGSFQAGYRALGPGAEDHPYYRKILNSTDSGNSSCVQNYMCSVTNANTPAAQATVGLVIGNLYQCTGTLLNDVSQDNTPYVLTARHCETGMLGGGNPGAAASVTVYFDATTPCGSALGSLYDPGIVTQTGASTILEQQDAWLIRLNTSPVVTDAQFAGFDASGGSVQGGYTVHHALGFDKQYVTWFGTALAVQDSGSTLGVGYTSDFLETVNATGNVGPGASGSGLFNQNNVLVGSATLGRTTSDPSGYESCPNPSLSPPNGSNGAAYFTPLAQVWNSTADVTSTTNPKTFEAILDPQNTGVVTVGSSPAASVSFTASTYSLPVGGTVTLTWSAPGATQCTASGGVSGDGWQGTLGGASSLQVAESNASLITYSLSCSLSANRTVTADLTITWGAPRPQLEFTGSNGAWINSPATLKWTSNLSPCSITGGSLSATNLPSSGSITTTQNSTGVVQYQIQCGPSTGYITTSWSISYVTPSVQFFANSTDLQLGQPLSLGWITAAQTCTPSGGAPNDGWTGTSFSNPQTNTGFNPNVTTLGTYTYTLSCSSGNQNIQKSVTVTFENNPGYATLSVAPATVTYSDSTADTVTLTYATNLNVCTLASQPVTGGEVSGYFSPTFTWSPTAPGTYSFTVTCNPYDTAVGAVTSQPVTVTVLAPPAATATMSVSPATVAVGQTFNVSWSTTNAGDCIGTGTPPPELVWQEVQAIIPPSGSEAGNSKTPGTYMFGISCPSVAPGAPSATAQVTLTVTPPPPTATLTASTSSLQVGQTLTLTWSSTNASGCQNSGGDQSGQGNWPGTEPASGTYSEAATVAGTFTFTTTCSQGNVSATAQVTVTVGNSSSGGSSGSGASSNGHSGGGALSALDLLVLAAVWTFAILRADTRRQSGAVARRTRLDCTSRATAR